MKNTVTTTICDRCNDCLALIIGDLTKNMNVSECRLFITDSKLGSRDA